MQKKRGFTLIELMTSIAIMTLITSVIIAQFSGFDSAIVTKARAYDAAQAVRSAQAFATQIRTGTASDIVFTTQFLARFTKGSGEIMIMRKEEGADPAAVEYRQLTAGYIARELCVVYANGTVHRATTNTSQFLDIAFRRPEVTASITPSWITVPSPAVRSYIGITGTDPSLIHWVEVNIPGSVAIVSSAPVECAL